MSQRRRQVAVGLRESGALAVWNESSDAGTIAWVRGGRCSHDDGAVERLDRAGDAHGQGVGDAGPADPGAPDLILAQIEGLANGGQQGRQPCGGEGVPEGGALDGAQEADPALARAGAATVGGEVVAGDGVHGAAPRKGRAGGVGVLE